MEATSAGFALGCQVAKDVSPLQNLFDTSRFEDFLSRHDPVWELPAKKWEQGLPLGNGDLGVMVWGSGNPLMFTLGKTDWWETRHWTPDSEHFKWRNFRRLIESKKLGSLFSPSSEEKAFQRPRGPNGEFTAARSGTPPPYATRLPVGRCELQPAGRIRTATMRLNLHTATGSGELTTDRGQIRWRCVVHASQPLIIVELDSDVAEESAEFSVGSFSDARWGSPEIINTLKTWGYPAARESKTGPVNHWSQDTPVGGQCAVAWREYSLSKSRRVVFLAIVFTADSRQAVAKADQVVSSVSPEDLPSLVASHKRWWASYYPASFLSIPDTRLEALYWMEMYKLGAGTRPDKLPLAVTGPWSEDNRMSPWGGTYCYNINVQMIYWPIYTANRLDYGRSLYRMIDQSRPRLREFCRQFFEREGEFLSHTSDMHGNPTYDWAVAEFEFNGLCWVSHHYWLHWRYSQDREFLRERCLPLMKEAVRVYLDELKEGADGRLHLPLGFSREYRGRGKSTWGPDPTIDLAMIRFVCGALLEGHRVLGTHDPEIPRWKTTLEKLAPYPEDNKEGLAVRADLPYETSHRHPSQLVPLYPLKLLTWEKDRELIERTLRNWIYQGHGEWVGFTFAWAACIAAHGSRAPLARTILLDYLDRYTTENSFNMNGAVEGSDLTIYSGFVFTAEAGFGAAAAIQDMVLQSHDDLVRVFPAAPPAWSAAEFWNLRAEGGFRVSAVRRDGKTRWVQITSEAGGPCRVKTEYCEGVLETRSSAGPKSTRQEGDAIVFDTVPGEEVWIGPAGQSSNTSIRGLQGREDEYHFFGVKHVPRW